MEQTTLWLHAKKFSARYRLAIYLSMLILTLNGCGVSSGEHTHPPVHPASSPAEADLAERVPSISEPALRTAVLLIDMQEDFWSPQIENLHPAMQNSVEELLRTSRHDGLEVAHIRSKMSPYPAARPKSYQLVFPHSIPCTEGTAGAQPLAFAKEQGDERIFYKNVLDGFQSGELHRYLQSKGIGHLVIAGLTTEVCVLNTAFSAMNHGYAVTIIDECCASNDPTAHQLILHSYDRFIFTRIRLQQFNSYRQQIERRLRELYSS